MPKIGDIKSSTELGYIDKHKRTWVMCPKCKKGRWVALSTTKRPTYTGMCHMCNAAKRGGNRIKKGYRWTNSNGYILVKLQPDNFFYSMTGKDGYVFEHRLVMAKHLCRNLHPWEIIHHKNHLRGDNSIGNLQLVSDDKHKQISILENEITRLQKQIAKLKEENRQLRQELPI